MVDPFGYVENADWWAATIWALVAGNAGTKRLPVGRPVAE
jgi:hypothetical protein